MSYENDFVPDNCDCQYDDETDKMIFMCRWCQPVISIPPTCGRWSVEINKIFDYIHIIDANEDIQIKINYIKEMYEYFLTCSNFFSESPRIRKVIVSKSQEFREEPDIKINTELLSLFDKVDLFISSLSTKN
jgi:hypothetical protein